MYAYLLFATTYMIFAFFDTLVEFNVILSNNMISDNYVNTMYTLIAILIFLSWYDRMYTNKPRADNFMPKLGPNPNLYSDISL